MVSVVPCKVVFDASCSDVISNFPDFAQMGKTTLTLEWGKTLSSQCLSSGKDIWYFSTRGQMFLLTGLMFCMNTSSNVNMN